MSYHNLKSVKFTRGVCSSPVPCYIVLRLKYRWPEMECCFSSECGLSSNYFRLEVQSVTLNFVCHQLDVGSTGDIPRSCCFDRTHLLKRECTFISDKTMLCVSSGVVFQACGRRGAAASAHGGSYLHYPRRCGTSTIQGFGYPIQGNCCRHLMIIWESGAGIWALCRLTSDLDLSCLWMISSTARPFDLYSKLFTSETPIKCPTSTTSRVSLPEDADWTPYPPSGYTKRPIFLKRCAEGKPTSNSLCTAYTPAQGDTHSPAPDLRHMGQRWMVYHSSKKSSAD